MEKLGIGLMVIVISIVAILILMNILSDKAIQMEREQTRQIQAQAESRLHSAQANAVIMTAFSVALLPWGILLVVSLFGLAVVALFGVLVITRREPSRIIERQILYLPPIEASRREVWKYLEDMKEKVIIER